MTTKTDCELVKIYIDGNETAIAVLLQRYKSRVYNYIYKKVSNPDVADDLFQDVFIKVILTLKEGKYNEEGKFLSWVLRISHNLVIDYFRASNKTQIINESYGGGETNIFDFIIIPELSIEDIMENRQVHRDLRELIKLLPEDQREVLELRYYKELSFKEISEEIDITINTALGRMRYAILNLRKLIKNKNVLFV